MTKLHNSSNDHSGALSCPHCRKSLPGDALFCAYCGQSLNGSGSATPESAGLHRLGPRHYIQHVVLGQERLLSERKYVTTLFADIVDSTPLAERLDPEDVTAVMNAAFGVMVRPIEKHDGIVARLMGDGILCLFGAPVAHRDDPIRACNAAMELIDNVRDLGDRMRSDYGLERLQIRVGISTGLAVVGEVGTEYRAEYTAMGDSVNLAARLQSAAQPGTVVICPQTYERIKKHFDVKSLGDLRLKGKSEPIRVYRLLRGVRDATAAGAAILPVVGRDGELAEARRFIEELPSGHGGMLNVLGGPGIGKSRFISELRKYQPQGTQWIHSVCRAQTQQVSFSNVVHALSQLLGFTDRLTPGEQRRMIERRCLRLCEDVRNPQLPDDSRRIPSPVRMSTALCHIFGLPLNDGEKALLSNRIGAELQRFLIKAIRHFIEYMAHRSPLVLIWEDVQWIDHESRGVISAIETRLGELPIALIVSQRPDTIKRTGVQTTVPSVRSIHLGPLDIDSSRQIAEGLLGGMAVPEPDLVSLIASVEGNPFFLEEVIRAYQSGDFTPASKEMDVRSTGLEMPHTVQAAILSRVDRLPAREKQLLQIGAVFGRSFDPQALGRVVEKENGHCDIRALLLGLSESGFITCQNSPADPGAQSESDESEAGVNEIGRCEFTHGLMVDVIYNSLLKSERKSLHRRIGDVLEDQSADDRDRLAPVLAYHYYRGDVPEKAVKYYARSGQQSLALFSLERAEHCFNRVLSLCDSTEPNADPCGLAAAHEGSGDILYYRAAYESALQHYDSALSMTNKPADLARLHRKRGDLFEKQAHWQEARSAYETGLDTMAEEFNESEAGLIYAGLCLVYYHLDDLDTASELGDLALLIEERQGNGSGIARARGNLGVVLTKMKAWEKARHHFELAHDQWEELDDAYGLGSCCNNMGLMEMSRDNFEVARALFEESLAHFKEIDNMQGMARVHDNLGTLHISAGNDEAARKHMEEAARLLGEIIADSGDLHPEIWRSGLW